MNFEDFAQSIISADLKAIAQHWNKARGEKLMPSWSDIRPGPIAKQLPLLWCYFYDPEQDEFVGRLGGEAIARIFGRPIKGAKLSELTPIIGRDKLVERFERAMQEPALTSGYGRLFAQDDSYGIGERIIMPLATDGVTGDAVMGATEYRMRGYIASEVEQLTEKEQWFSLAPNPSQQSAMSDHRMV